MESFELRRMLSVDVPADPTAEINTTTVVESVRVKVSKTGTLHITGTGRADQITVTTSGNKILVLAGRSTTITIDSKVKRVSVQGRGGKDSVIVNLDEKIKAKLVGGKGKDSLTRATRSFTDVQVIGTPIRQLAATSEAIRVAYTGSGDSADPAPLTTVMYSNALPLPQDLSTLAEGRLTLDQTRAVMGDDMTEWFISSGKRHRIFYIKDPTHQTELSYDDETRLVTVDQLTDFDPFTSLGEVSLELKP